MNDEKPVFEWRRFLITAVLVIFASGVTFAATWYVLDKSTAEQNEASDKLRVELQKQIDDLSKKVTVAAKTSDTTDATDSWNSYTSTDYKYTVKYPKTWVYKDYADPKFPYVAFADKNENLPASVNSGIQQIATRIVGLQMTKETLVSPEDLSKVTEEDVTVAGVSAKKFTKLPGRKADAEPDTKMVFYQLQLPSGKYLELSGIGDANITILENMIKTLKLS